MNYGLPENFNPRQIDPALLTFREWSQIVDPDQKCHPDTAYDVGLDRFKAHAGNRSKNHWPRLIQQIRRNGITFEIRLGTEKIGRCVKSDPDGNVLYIDGEVQYYTDEELKRLGKRLYEWSLAVFHGDQQVASVQDEWGCVLVTVAREYRSFGLGALLIKIARSIQPDKPSGGFTTAGYQTFARVHAEFVRDALRFGQYTKLVRQGQLSLERVKEIIASAKPASPKRPETNLNSDDPNDWLMYVGEYGDFIVYDRKLRNIIDEGERFDHFAEKMVRGIVYVLQMSERNNYAYLRTFGGETIGIKRLLVSCAVEFAIREHLDLYLENDEISSLDPAMGTIEPASNKIGFMSQRVVPTGKRLNYDGYASMERKWRKTFDRYDEFRMRFMEMAYSKYAPS